MISRFLGRPRPLGKVRVRYAPSPTGSLHLGGLRTALYNMLFARKNKGSFVLRIEDTDRKRLVPEATADIYNVLKWAAVEPDEGPVSQLQPYGPYVQSERRAIYNQYLERLKKSNAVYPCFCSSERLDQLNSQQRKEKRLQKYDGLCRGLSTTESDILIGEGKPHTYRFRNDVVGISFRDATFGCVSVEEEHLDDFIMVKSDGWPTYHFANVVDDIEMKISHVIRGQEWLTSTPKHLLLYHALDHQPPEFVHLPLILSPSGGKLSKRDNSTAVQWYITQGYQPEAVVNTVALLGWTPVNDDSDLMTMQRLIDEFDIYKVHKSPATLDLKKLDSLNRQSIKRKYMPTNVKDRDQIDGLRKTLGAPATNLDDEQIYLLSKIALERITRISQVHLNFQYVFGAPDLTSKGSQDDFKKLFGSIEPLRMDDGKLCLPQSAQLLEQNRAIIRNVYAVLGAVTDITQEAVKIAMAKAATLSAKSQEQLYHLVRFCLTGRASGPGLQKIVCLLSKETMLKRLQVWL